MKDFLKKYSFGMILSVVAILFVYVCFYMLWVHVPYATKQNELNSIKNRISEEYTLRDVTYFNEYHSNETYYVVMSTITGQYGFDKQYTVYDEKLKVLDQTQKILLKQEEAKQLFVDKYDVNPTQIEIGYENQEFVYCMTYKKEDKLLYAFYGVESGEFLKAYSL